MQVHITGRQVAITPALRKYAEEKLKKVDKLLGGSIEAHVVLVVEKRRHLAEIQVKSRTALLGRMSTRSSEVKVSVWSGRASARSSPSRVVDPHPATTERPSLRTIQTSRGMVSQGMFISG